ncbi:oxygen-insensitive NADPH nitroreductase [Metabacillus idriensis]|uniref:Oxygen-insensitive NADPH nitroreductase n=1 Tax=Metabacillus idriensis TaxID=324768 RepID=A0A6I2M7I4_9BACI|nr:oxygen-insensitive NADPH nitroreductase [Metabacillus idriensis]MCM3597349.1 oxygen-insensitive NADPH nitroreductase [Metabacillus idriensis]MRX54098.1 oxygen-insensitive NADPH nitroreductase [Metabacillus idriensis]OHR73299.1 NADPH-dependent oxidoreductase [Bacillus sp. HMSC76G11]
MNNVIDTILSHRSIRKFEEKLLSDEQIKTIVECAQAASTSSFIQAYSIIGVKNPATKQRLAELAGNQSYVAQNGHFFIFCADLHRHEVLAEMEGVNLDETLESTEKFMVAAIDASLAAQNAVIAAESMGLGAVYIGGLRNSLNDVSELLKTPDRVVPLFGLAVGYPAQNPDKKPRIQTEHIYHEEAYETDSETYIRQLEDYNRVISAYYHERTEGKRTDTWTSQMAAMLSKPTRMYMKEFVESRGFNKR